MTSFEDIEKFAKENKSPKLADFARKRTNTGKLEDAISKGNDEIAVAILNDCKVNDISIDILEKAAEKNMEQFIRTVFDKKLIDINKKEDNKDKELINKEDKENKKEDKELIKKEDKEIIYFVREILPYYVKRKHIDYYLMYEY